MVAFALEQPEVQAAQVGLDFEVLPPLTPEEQAEDERFRQLRGGRVAPPVPDTAVDTRRNAGSSEAAVAPAATTLARKVVELLRNSTIPKWLIKDVIERGVIAVMAGKRGSYKSFLALDWAMQCAVRGDDVYVISAEGGDFDRRAQAWLFEHAPDEDIETLPLYVVEKRINLNSKEKGVEPVRQDCVKLGIKPVLFVLDTLSKLSGGLEENDNTDVKQFIGLLDNGLKREFGATVLLVAHTGHGDQTRVRGASALGADSDAEYIVAKNELDGVITVTRERFKSSPELPPLYYLPEIVDLERTDEEGNQLTSVVLRPAPANGKAGNAMRLPKHQRNLLALAREVLAHQHTVSVDELVEAYKETIPFDGDGKKDRRRRNAMRALEGLVEGKWLALRDSKTVALNHATKAEQADFL